MPITTPGDLFIWTLAAAGCLIVLSLAAAIGLAAIRGVINSTRYEPAETAKEDSK